MGKIINALLKNKVQKDSTKLSFLDLFTPFFSNEANPRLNDTFMACCQAHARHGAKFAPSVYLGEVKSKNKRYITDLLTLRPNKLMNAPTFWEKVTENYFESNNVFIYLDYDWSDFKQPLKSLYPLDPEGNQLEVRRGDDGALYLQFMMGNAKYTVSTEQVVHIARNVNAGEFFGHSNRAIETVLRVIQTNYEGMEQAIKTSAFLRFIVQTTTPMTAQTLKEKSDYFAQQYLGKNATGIAYIDGAEQIVPINSQLRYANAEEVDRFEKKIYNYLGISEKILQATYNEDEWAAYYESSLEPLVLKLETELTYKLFTTTERTFGNTVKIDANRLQTASLKTRGMIAQIIQKMPVYVPNTINELLYLPKTDHGDVEYSNLNFVKTSDQSEYQTGNSDGDLPVEPQEDENGKAE